ncbi:hypothetical protein HYP85_gp032 [Pseudomonas phage Zuri]|uniref:Uncharacterized protein n=1 Tax=Pseudomonas phage Zuri TaxID=2604899 RepID=A0A5C1K5I8_9CAUD|nr:hypothetical protein HYP85_gp032 [Pseudomonas phage Zuri]QEM41129.1 hypothetical protein Zuri_32 [Pseudomonas phage Zuri]
MNKLSTGDDSTLGNHRKLAIAAFGKDSAAVKFLDDKIKEQGEDEEVIQDEGQMVYLLANIHFRGLSQ